MSNGIQKTGENHLGAVFRVEFRFSGLKRVRWRMPVRGRLTLAMVQDVGSGNRLDDSGLHATVQIGNYFLAYQHQTWAACPVVPAGTEVLVELSKPTPGKLEVDVILNFEPAEERP
jgi:hypothetical protein